MFTRSFELTKALAVRISVLVDSHKQDYSCQMNNVWSDKVDAVTDLIQVLCNHTTAEFQHFYELLLARRLLKGRYIR